MECQSSHNRHKPLTTLPHPTRCHTDWSRLLRRVTDYAWTFTTFTCLRAWEGFSERSKYYCNSICISSGMLMLIDAFNFKTHIFESELIWQLHKYNWDLSAEGIHVWDLLTMYTRQILLLHDSWEMDTISVPCYYHHYDFTTEERRMWDFLPHFSALPS